LSTICYDEKKNIILKFKKSTDSSKNFQIFNFLNLAKFEQTSLETLPEVNFTLFLGTNRGQFLKIIDQITEKFTDIFGTGSLELCTAINDELNHYKESTNSFDDCIQMGLQVKSQSNHNPLISPTFKRKLMDHQNESVEHLNKVRNVANFSVPGAGKTTMALAGISNLIDEKKIEKILVIGPTASFLPWEQEFQICFGRKSSTLRLNMETITNLNSLAPSYELFLLHYQTASIYTNELINFLQNYKTFLIVDESHRIKNPKGGKWANNILSLAPFAERRMVLSGTPMPNDFKDLWNQIQFLWPGNNPLGTRAQYEYNLKHSNGHIVGHNREILDALFCRVKKDDLNLPKPNLEWHTVPFDKYQREIYQTVAESTLKQIQSYSERLKISKLRGAYVKVLQAASNPDLLQTHAGKLELNNVLFAQQFGFNPETDEEKKEDKIEIEPTELNRSVYDKIVEYTKLGEIPSKMVESAKIAKEIMDAGRKVIIWTTFIDNSEILVQLLDEFNPIIINGTIAKNADEDPQDNREIRIEDFKNDKNPRVLIATASSIGESVSLHKNLKGETVCSDAIYLERNYNGAQFMQSMDRIHRIGMNPDIQVNYHFILGEHSIDQKVDKRLFEKWGDMTKALNDSFLDDLELEKGKKIISKTDFEKDRDSFIEHLREIS